MLRRNKTEGGSHLHPRRPGRNPKCTRAHRHPPPNEIESPAAAPEPRSCSNGVAVVLTGTFREGASGNKGVGAYAATGAAGCSLGLVIGGLLSELGWRYVFLVPAPLTAIIVIAALRVLESRNELSLAHRHYDLLGALTVTGSMVALVYSVVEAPSRGWLDARTIGGLAISSLLLIS